KLRVLEPGVHELHLCGAFQVLPGQRHEVGARFQGRHPQSPAGQGTRELAASAPDLQHTITAPDPRDPAGPVDELLRIHRTVAVVLGRDLVEHPAVTTPGRFRQRCHSLASGHDRHRDRHVSGPHQLRLSAGYAPEGENCCGRDSWPRTVERHALTYTTLVSPL